MYYARLKNGIVEDIIVLEDAELIPLFAQGFDEMVEVDLEPGGVQVGWIKNEDGSFEPGPEPTPEPEPEPIPPFEPEP